MSDARLASSIMAATLARERAGRAGGFNGGRLRSMATSARKLGEPHITVGGLTCAEVVAEAEEQQGKNGREDGRKQRDG